MLKFIRKNKCNTWVVCNGNIGFTKDAMLVWMEE
jgi:hypothetical protein